MNTPQTLTWTPARIERFFDFLSRQPGIEDNYFSNQRGRALLRFVRRRLPLHGHVLDVGCGPGYFLRHLAQAGVSCSGADVSEHSVSAARSRCAGMPKVGAIRRMPDARHLPFPEGSVDVAFLIETIEHLLDADLAPLLADIRRTLAASGHLVVTTPYREVLSWSMVTCPSCGARFHDGQHVRSLDVPSLSTLLATQGFRTVVCRPVLLLPEWPIWLRSKRNRAHRKKACPACGTVFERPTSLGAFRKTVGELRHLVYIGARDRPA